MHFKSQIYTKYLTSFPLWNIGSVQNITNGFDLCSFFFSINGLLITNCDRNIVTAASVS